MESWNCDEGVPSRPAEAATHLVQDLDRTDHPDAICSAIQRFIENFGFNSVTCVMLPRSGDFDAASILMSTLPTPYLQSYLAKGLFRFDPIVKEVQRRREAFSWSEMRKARRLSRQEQDVLRFAATFGITSGFTIPVRESTGNVGFINVTGPAVKLNGERRAALVLAAIYGYQRLCSLRQSATEPARKLTNREAETLRWIARGKSDWQVGQILGISEKTVNYHIENVKRKFGVATRIQAVVAAIERQSCHIDGPAPVRSSNSRS